ncbi:MAG: hypothetical protein C0596_16505 [Marinilabiliales bacterium]|nr:MAG: hypothetical protein C0596_16505 [Marinilabiliales bacterium]
MCQFLETIKIKDGKPQNLDYHQYRLERTLKDLYNHKSQVLLEKKITVPEEYASGLIKCRFLYNIESFEIKFSKYEIKMISKLKIVEADDLKYNYKYVDRSYLNRLLEKREECDDILIIKNGFITDLSFANICFNDGDKWYTPSSPLLEGTCRSRLLDKKVIQPKEIKISDLSKYQYFTIINAMRGEDLTDIQPIRNIII